MMLSKDIILGVLLPEHRADFERSGLSVNTIEQSGAYSVNQLEANKLLGFDPGSGGWVLPYPHRQGLPDTFDFKPDIPFVGSDGKSRKYLKPLNSTNRVYVPPMIPVERLQSRREVLVITEGGKKALKAVQEGIVCVALSGVWNWKFRDEMNDSRTIEGLSYLQSVPQKNCNPKYRLRYPNIHPYSNAYYTHTFYLCKGDIPKGFPRG